MTQLLSRTSLVLATVLALGTSGATFAQMSKDKDPAGEMAQVCSLEWTQADANGDGAITADEAQGPLRDQFAAIDANGDGSISADEYESCGKA